MQINSKDHRKYIADGLLYWRRYHKDKGDYLEWVKQTRKQNEIIKEKMRNLVKSIDRDFIEAYQNGK